MFNTEPKEKRKRSAYEGIEDAIRNSSIAYSLGKSHDNETIYRNGRFITVHEEPLQFGLLGFTNTVDYIFLSTKDDFGVPREKVFVHEKLHCSEPDRSEMEIRYMTDAEFEPLDTASVNFSIYRKPAYDY